MGKVIKQKKNFSQIPNPDNLTGALSRDARAFIRAVCVIEVIEKRAKNGNSLRNREPLGLDQVCPV